MKIENTVYSARTFLNYVYEEYRNDYLTVEKFAADNGLFAEDARELINLARRVYNSKHPEE